MRLCVNTGNRLHLIRPLGFELDDARLRRAGLDYREYASVDVHDDYAAFLGSVRPRRVFAFTPHAPVFYTEVQFEPGDVLLFGRESDGLPGEISGDPSVTERLSIPIAEGGRSLNLANAAAIAVYEAWRQLGFEPNPALG